MPWYKSEYTIYVQDDDGYWEECGSGTELLYIMLEVYSLVEAGLHCAVWEEKMDGEGNVSDNFKVYETRDDE